MAVNSIFLDDSFDKMDGIQRILSMLLSRQKQCFAELASPGTWSARQSQKKSLNPGNGTTMLAFRNRVFRHGPKLFVIRRVRPNHSRS